MWQAFAAWAANRWLSEEDKRNAEKSSIDRQATLNRMALEQEKASIMGRVDAAKAAGIHPLVAMGAQGLGGPVVSAPVIDTGFMPIPSPQRDPVDQRSPDQRRRDAAEADLAELQVEAARRRLATQPGNAGAPNELTGTGAIVHAEATPYPVRHVKIEGQTLPPSSVTTRHQTPGVAPGWDVVQIGTMANGRPIRMVVPGGSVQRENWGEQLGELPVFMWPEVIRQSAEATGISTGEWIQRGIFGEGVQNWNRFYRGLGEKYEAWRRANHERNMARQPKE